MPCIARRDGRFFPCDPICSRFGYDKQGTWTEGFSLSHLSKETMKPRMSKQLFGLGSQWDIFGCMSVEHAGHGFTVLIFSSSFWCVLSVLGSKARHQKEVPNLRNQGKNEGACCADILGNGWASGKNFSNDRRRERGKRRFRLFLAKSYIQLTLKFPSPKDYY